MNKDSIEYNGQVTEQGLYIFRKNNGDGTWSEFICDPDDAPFYDGAMALARTLDAEGDARERRIKKRTAYRAVLKAQHPWMTALEEAVKPLS